MIATMAPAAGPSIRSPFAKFLFPVLEVGMLGANPVFLFVPHP